MALRNIVEIGDPILRKQCRPVGEVTDRTRLILDDMVETMKQAGGVGLAAPQVGIMRRMFVAEPEEGQVLYMVDPEIISMEGEQTGQEGCLSVPSKIGTVTRPEKVVIKAKDRDGVEHEYNLEGFAAVVICHEFDHLEGVMYVDKSDDVQYIED